MQSVAIGWYLYDRTGDAMVLAYAGLAVFLPIALFSLPGGDVADRVDRRWILGSAHLAQATGSMLLVFLTWTGTDETWPFYGVLALSAGIGIALNFTPINPISALYWSAVVNGVLAVPVMVLLMLMARRHDVMGKFVINRGALYWLGWLSTAAMMLSVIAMGVGFLVGR